jgi:ribokinase
MDLVIGVERLVRTGETLLGGELELFPGGKGANQACAAARLVGNVDMVAPVGKYLFGSRFIASPTMPEWTPPG